MNTPSNKANHYKLLFICLGNICRSPAADAVMHRLVESKELSHKFSIDSGSSHCFAFSTVSAGIGNCHVGYLPYRRMR